MKQEIVTVSVAGGGRYSSWLSVNLRGSVREAARTCKIEIAAEFGAKAAHAIFADQTPMQVYGGSDLIFSGYVFDRVPEIGPKGPAKITITGRTKAADVIDCSVDHTKPDYVNKTLLDIAKDQDSFGVGFSADFDMEPIDRFRFNPGESIWRGLEILCRDQAATMAGQANGSIKLTQAGKSPPRQPGALIEGVNIKLGSASHNSMNRHSEVHLHGQAYKGVGKPYTQINAVAKDGSVRRHRPVHILHRGHATKKRIKKHAEHRRDREAGEGLTAVITTAGWRDETGAIWAPGNKVWTESDFLDLSQDMLIESVDYLQSPEGGEGGGDRCVLSLVDPRAHGGSGGGVNKSGDGWSLDNSSASG